MTLKQVSIEIEVSLELKNVVNKFLELISNICYKIYLQDLFKNKFRLLNQN